MGTFKKIFKWSDNLRFRCQKAFDKGETKKMINDLKVTPTSCLFTKLARSQVFAQFFVRVFVLGWYTYFETAQISFFLRFREKGLKTLKIYE